MPVEPAPTSSKTIHHEKVLSMTPELRKEWAIMFLSEPFGSHIWSKDSNEFPFSSQGCINQSFSSWQVSSWFSSEKPSLSKYPKKQITWVEEVSRKFKTDPVVVGMLECLSPNSLVPKFRYPSSNLGSPFSISIKKRRKGYRVHYTMLMGGRGRSLQC